MFRAVLLAAVLIAPAPRPRSLDAPTPSGVQSAPRTDLGVHALAGYASAGSGYAAAIAVDADAGERLVAAGTAALAAGLAKEAFDRWGQGERASTSDLLATALGGAAFVLLAGIAGS